MDEILKQLAALQAQAVEAANLAVLVALAKRQGRLGHLPLACARCGAAPTARELARSGGKVCLESGCEGSLREIQPKSVGLEHDVQEMPDDGEDRRDRTGPTRPVDDGESDLDADGRTGPRRAGRRDVDSEPGFARSRKRRIL